jgi:2-polyprenyl-3-methyl-5-hydroxy-6-metoxy-1,4-benzoquinol methylase
MVANGNGDGSLTQGEEYAARLVSLQSAAWKEKLRFLDPYGWHVKIICKGNVLEIGSGIGRNLRALKGRSVGVDHNETSVNFANKKGLKSFTSEQFLTNSEHKSQEFDTLLLSHVLEHIEEETQNEIFNQYLPFLKPNARIVVICPQEVGFESDPTHIRWVDEAMLMKTLISLNCHKIRISSFPFPRRLGTKFIYNQFVAVGQLN